MKTICVVALVLGMAACAADNGGVPLGGDDTSDAPDAMVGDPSIDARPTTNPPIDAAPMGLTAPGGACSCDADCADEGTHDGVCIFGVCMTEASATCASGGSQAECPAGSRCWGLSDFDGGSLCWPDCDAHTCAGTCDSDGSCVPAAEDNCDPSCGSACTCTETSCGDGQSCIGGECVADVDVGDGPGAGPGPACTSLPARDCTSNCGDLVVFDPRTNTAWDDYAINGETTSNQYRSYLRRDLRQLVMYATSKVACKAASWDGTARALGLGDMSESNGAIPGTSINDPGHPDNTHENGYDIDLAYYQLGTADNKLRPICPYTTSTGANAYHCTGAPTTLDVWRTAMFLGSVFESSRVRVIGVDGQAGPLLLSALDQLCDDGWLSGAACSDVALAYETTNMNLGWYYHHHHHAHISLEQASAFQLPSSSIAKRTLPGRPAGIHTLD